MSKEHNLAGIRAYNRWLADLCSANPERHAGVALINVDDVSVAVDEIREAKAMGLWGGVLLPTSTADNPYYHDPCYEPLWAVCEELDMPLHSHSGWSPDYGDADCATAMFISEVDKYAQRAFAPLVWSGAFERHPGLKFVFTEAGCQWILETLRVLEREGFEQDAVDDAEDGGVAADTEGQCERRHDRVKGRAGDSPDRAA